MSHFRTLKGLRISTHDGQRLEAICVTKKLLREYVEVIEKAGLGSDEAAKEEARRDAAVTFIEGIETESAEVEALLDILMEHQRVKGPLAERIAEVEKAALESWEQDTADQRKRANEELIDIQHEIVSATNELKTMRSSIDRALRDILDAPVEAMLKHGLSDALFRSLPSLSTRSSAIEQTTVCPPVAQTPITSNVGVIVDTASLKKTMTSWAFDTGVDPYVLNVALAAVLAHRVTLLTGAKAERLARALASTLAGDNAVRVSVGTAVFGLADIMHAAIMPVGSTQLDGPTTLGRFLAIQNPERIAVVILSGCNRAPLEVVLPDFQSALEEAHSMLAWSNIDGSVDNVMLHSRMRLIGTLHDGSATYSVPPMIAGEVAVIPADHREFDFDPPQISTPEPTRVDRETFDALSAPSENDDLTELVRWLSTSGSTLPASTLRRILTVYLNLLSDPMRAPAEAIAGMVLGRDREPPLADLPVRYADSIRDHLIKLSDSAAWQTTRCHFAVGDTR